MGLFRTMNRAWVLRSHSSAGDQRARKDQDPGRRSLGNSKMPEENEMQMHGHPPKYSIVHFHPYHICIYNIQCIHMYIYIYIHDTHTYIHIYIYIYIHVYIIFTHIHMAIPLAV